MTARFSHVPYATDYMQISVSKISEHFGGDLSGKTTLDLPAGNGWVTEQLKKLGANAIAADINEERPDYAQVDMEKPLPFTDAQFDAILCAEGIEHVFNPSQLFNELARVLKPGGILIITTPNVQNIYSRWQHFCCGYLFQFDPFNKIPLKDSEVRDKGHISPVFYTQLRYYARCHNLFVHKPTGGRMKKLFWLPLFLPFLLWGAYWTYRDWQKTSGDPEMKIINSHLFSLRVLLSRSLVFSCEKTANQKS